jgi:hypothetical protein
MLRINICEVKATNENKDCLSAIFLSTSSVVAGLSLIHLVIIG